jgi:hypothetical protein
MAGLVPLQSAVLMDAGQSCRRNTESFESRSTPLPAIGQMTVLTRSEEAFLALSP